MNRTKHVVYPLGYVLLLCAVSIAANWAILLPIFKRLRGANMLSVTVYSFYYCPAYVAVTGLLAGLAASFLHQENERKKNYVILGVLSLIILAVQAFLFPS